MTTEPISLTESKQLVSLESKIEAGQKTFLEVGLALAEIRDNKLYRSDYSTFEDYCKEKWGWEKRYWQYVIAASETVRNLPEPSRTIVHSESQARELSKAAPEQREEVLRSVAAKGPVTAKAIREEIQEVVEVENPEPVSPPTLESKFKAATANLEIPPVEPELTPFQEFEQDIAYVCEKAIARITTCEPGKCKLTLAVWIKKFTQAEKAQTQ